MWISQGTWLNQLLWNNFRIIYGDKYHLRFQYQALVQSKQLGVFGLDDHRLNRLKLIKSLSDKGMSTVEISEYLNYQNIQTPTGLSYYPKLVWMTLFKYKRRLKRDLENELLRSTESLTVGYRNRILEKGTDE